MKLLEFKIREYHSYNWKTVDLNSDVCVFYSKNNSTGKTTLMRAILYTLGFSIPNTDFVRFEHYEFILELSHQDKHYTLMRKDQLLKINDTEFDLRWNNRLLTLFCLVSLMLKSYTICLQQFILTKRKDGLY